MESKGQPGVLAAGNLLGDVRSTLVGALVLGLFAMLRGWLAASPWLDDAALIILGVSVVVLFASVTALAKSHFRQARFSAFVAVVALASAAWIAFVHEPPAATEAHSKGGLSAQRDEFEAMEPLARYVKDQLIRPAYLVTKYGPDALANRVFDNCRFVGPAVLGLQGNGNWYNPRFIVESPEEMDLMILGLEDGQGMAGIIIVEGSEFRDCTFEKIGIVTDKKNAERAREELKRGTHGPKLRREIEKRKASQ